MKLQNKLIKVRNNSINQNNTIIQILYLLIISISLSPILIHNGWPMNHEWWSFFDRIQIYTRHLKQFDIIPLWSTNDGLGMGSPLPLFYHKLFYFPASIFYIIIGNMKISVLLTITVFLEIGCFGIYKICRLVDLDNISSILFSLCIIFLNYTITNWFVRGAMAEFSASMIIPYMILWCIDFIITKKFKLYIIPVFVLIYLAHSVIAYYTIFSIIIVIGYIILRNYKIFNYSHFIKRALISGFYILFILSIYLIPMLICSNNFNISKIKGGYWAPIYNFQPFHKYILDKFTWQHDWQNMTIQFDLPVSILIIFTLTLLFYLKHKKQPDIIYKEILPINQIIIFTIVLDIFYILLQFKFMNFFYKIVPGAEYIQFPWRLLAFIQILNLLILIILTKKLYRYLNLKYIRIIPFILLVILLIHYPIFRKSKFNWFQNKFVEEKRTNYGTFGIGEYMPNVEQIPASPSIGIKKYYSEINTQTEVLRGSCISKLIKPIASEQLSVLYKIKSNGKSVVIFPYNFSGLELLQIIGQPKKVFWYRTNIDPRIHAILPDGKYTLQIIFPKVSNLFHTRNILRQVKEPIIPKFQDVCNAENISSDETKIFSIKGYPSGNYQSLSKEFALSGFYSVKVNNRNPIGFYYELKDAIPGEVFDISVFEKVGSNHGYLIVEDSTKKYKLETHTWINTNKESWKKLDIRFVIPSDIPKTKFFTYVCADKDSVYFDNLLIKKWN